MEYKLVEISHTQFEHSLWKDVWDTLTILFTSIVLRKLHFIMYQYDCKSGLNLSNKWGGMSHVEFQQGL